MSSETLNEYNKKRNFKLTKEPRGQKKTAKKKAKELIFVVQEHHARRLHYDFRLELDGVLKSWAVPKGPSLDPSEKRLAVQTEDHPLPYAKFHGTIPEGEYGAGEVFIWDKGTWECLDEDPLKALKKGELKFKLKGKKLKGSFVLVRTNLGNDPKKRNWLLIKHRDEVSKKKTSLKQDLWPGFIKPELPRLVTSVPDGSHWIHEIKFDGYRMQGHIRNGIGTLFTRSGLDWSNKFPHILNGIEKIPVHDAIFDGEIVASSFQNLQNSIKSKRDQSLRYYVFDLLYLNGEDLRELPLIERKEKLKEILSHSEKEIIYSDHISEESEKFFEVSCENQLEGVVSKMIDAPYHSGRGDLWVKTKCSQRQEFVIGGWTDPRGGRQGLGALLLGVYEKGKLRYVGRVGTGFNQKLLFELKKELAKLEIKRSRFEIASPKGNEIHWVRPVKVCEVNFSEWTEDRILRTPVFLGMREDKGAKGIHMEKAVKQISSPEKLIFKEEKITKSDVSDYYQKIAKLMLTHIADRPLSLVRCPEGGSGECFFQKHIHGDKRPYVSINSLAELIELVQLNAFELHTWNCHQDDILSPDQLVMDFDPGPGVYWKEVVVGAFDLKDLLDALGLKSFVKVTGGKGIHVHIPIARDYSWGEVKSFANSLALTLVEANPKKYTANMSKSLRKNKIFVDYLRNGYGATAVAPYSLRARPKSAVAMPVEWSELRRIKGANTFDMPKALHKIKTRKRDPWKGMERVKQKIAVLDQQKAA